MKYNLIGSNNREVVDTVLFNRDISNVEELLNPKTLEEHYSNLDHIDIAVDTFLKHCKNKSKILVIVDADVDGLTSSAFICNYMRELNIEFEVHIHDGKKHGITPDAIEHINELNPKLLIVPDASSSEGGIHKSLIDLGIDIIILDHHEVEGESPAIIVNNQSSTRFSNKNLSGVGIVYKFCQAVDDKLGITGFCNKYLDLVAVGMISDVMDLRNIETRMLCRYGLNNIVNPFFKVLFEKEDVEDPTIVDVGFKIAPPMNALIRVGTMEEKRMLFDALSGMEYPVKYKPRGKSETTQSLAEAVIRMGNNAKSRQRTLTKKAVENISKHIIDNDLVDNKVLIVDVTGLADKSITGLVANKLTDTYKRPVMLVHKTSQDTLAGSVRGYGVSNLKDICSNSGLFELCAGHQESFGVEFNIDNLIKINQYFNELFKDVEYSLAYDVDYIFEAKDLTKQVVETIGGFKHLWGNGINEPLFVVKNIRISSKDVKKLGFNMVTFCKNDIFYIKNFANSSFIDEITCRDQIGFGEANLVIDMVCKFTQSKYGSRVEIVDYISRLDTDLIF